MRFEGLIKSWNDERGFGFIEPAQGGEEIFVHVSAIPTRWGRPQPGQPLSFEVGLNREGKKRATNVGASGVAVRAPARKASRTADRQHDRPAEWSMASAIAIPLFVVLYVYMAFNWRVSVWFALAYGVASLLCLLVYAIDKSAAIAGRRRVPEQTLHLLALAGGWPGAIIAQQMLRHKSSKAAFRVAFWFTVVANVAAFVTYHAKMQMI